MLLHLRILDHCRQRAMWLLYRCCPHRLLRALTLIKMPSNEPNVVLVPSRMATSLWRASQSFSASYRFLRPGLWFESTLSLFSHLSCIPPSYPVRPIVYTLISLVLHISTCLLLFTIPCALPSCITRSLGGSSYSINFIFSLSLIPYSSLITCNTFWAAFT